MKFTVAPKLTKICRLMEMLARAEETGKVAIVPFIEQAIRQVALEA